MDEIEKRLREGSEHCFNCYEAWKKNQKDAAAREALMEAIHELRKIASRLEIELAVSERDEMAQRPIPIPPHRDAQRRGHAADENGNGNGNDFDNAGNSYEPRQQPRPQHGRGPMQPRRLGRRSEGSGGFQGGGNNEG